MYAANISLFHNAVMPSVFSVNLYATNHLSNAKCSDHNESFPFVMDKSCIIQNSADFALYEVSMKMRLHYTTC